MAVAITPLRAVFAEFPALDPWMLAPVVTVRLIVAWVATYLPARRLSRLDPAIVVRNE
jgi:ABC-type lipoprotein release transport system permease subunit